MENQKVKPAEGKFGIMVVGLGAVSSTFMTGVLMARKGLAKPVGSMTQYDRIRVGKGADKKYYLMGRLYLWQNWMTSFWCLGRLSCQRIPKCNVCRSAERKRHSSCER